MPSGAVSFLNDRSLSEGKLRKTLWIAWEKQIRNRSMAAGLSVPLLEVISERGRLARYLSCTGKTVELIRRERPSVVICPNPSLVGTILLLGLRNLLGFRVAVDAHFGGVEAFNGSKIMQQALDLCNRLANLVIVTNEDHANYIRRLGGRAFVCPDPLPDLSRYRGKEREVPGKVFFICSFDIDEPFHEAFKAAEFLLPEGFRFFVSGNYRKVGISRRDYPHVELLGFVPESEFYGHLFSSQLVVDLTDHENCLVCGAYEALEAGKPQVLSRKKALQGYFTGGAVFTENDALSIAAAVRKAHAERSRLAEQCWQLASRKRAQMLARLSHLADAMEGL
jgi:hypothetical protein